MNQGINNMNVEIFPQNEHRKRFENFQAIQKNNRCIAATVKKWFLKKVVILPA